MIVTKNPISIALPAAGRGNFTLEQFLRWAAVGRTTAYQEIAAGRLVALKCGNRTLIPVASAEAWRAALPRIKSIGPAERGLND